MSRHTLTRHDLSQFTGSETWWRHPIVRRITYTDGARHVAIAGGAYWLIDEIAFAQCQLKVAAEPFQVWRLVVAENRSGVLTCGDGNDRIVASKRIPWTDFPLDEITLYCTNHVILLPGEY